MRGAVAVIGDPLWRAGLGLGVVVWPDGDGPGRLAAGRLVADLRRRGAAATLATVPDDQAALAAPLHPPCRKGTR